MDLDLVSVGATIPCIGLLAEGVNIRDPSSS